jgi:hypothetical protein
MAQGNAILFQSGLDGIESRLIQIDSESLGAILRDYVIQGSGRNVLLATDVVIRLPSIAAEGDDVPILELLESGTSLFAALIYVNSDDRANFRYEAAKDWTGIWTAESVAKMLFAAYFYILTQNRAINLVVTEANFMRTTIGMAADKTEIGIRLFESGFEKIPHDWVRSIRIRDLQPESRNRLGLGIAGYRLLQAFQSIEHVAEAPADAVSAWGAIRASVNRGYFYGFDAHFRNERFIQRFVSLNKVLNDLLARWGDPEQVAAAVDRKILAVRPTMDLRYRVYNRLTEANFREFETDPITA